MTNLINPMDNYNFGGMLIYDKQKKEKRSDC